MFIKRAALSGAILWIIIFVLISILMFAPPLKDKVTLQYIIYWILLVPITFFVGKWYFKMDSPAVTKGFYLGLTILLVSTILDWAVTIPLFISPQAGGYTLALKQFYGDWHLWFGLVEILVLCTVAGGEYDGTYTKV